MRALSFAPRPAFAMLHVHNRANTPLPHGHTPTYVPSVHPLPVEIIRVVSLTLLCRSGPPRAGDTTSELVTKAIWIITTLVTHVLMAREGRRAAYP